MFGIVYDGCMVDLVWSFMHVPLKHVTCYDFGPSVYSFEIELPFYEIILSAQGSKGVITNWLLTTTLWPNSLPCHVQVMILVGAYRFFNCAFASVDECYLYIINHNSMS